MAGKSVVVVISGKDDSGAVFDAVKNHLDEVKKHSEEAESSIGELGERMKTALEFSGIYMGIEELREGLKEAIKGTAEFAEQLERAQVRTGMTGSNLAFLAFAAKMTGASFDQLVNGASRLGANLGKAADGNKELNATFAAAGINAKDLAGRADGVDAAFRKLTQAIASTESPARRNQLAMELLGKAGVELIPTLVELGEREKDLQELAERTGNALTNEQVAALGQLNEALKETQAYTEGAEKQFSVGLEPALVSVLQSFQSGAGDVNVFKDAGIALGAVIRVVVSGVDTLIFGLEEIADVLIGSTMAAWKFTEAVGNIARLRPGAALADIKKMGDGFHFAQEDSDAFRKSMEQLWSAPKEMKVIPPPKDGGFAGAPVKQKATHDKMLGAEERYQQALRALAEEGFKLTAMQQKAALDEQLASLESSHKLMLISDRTYFDEKRAISEQEAKAELAAIQRDREALQKQMDSVSKTKPKDKVGKVEQQTKLADLQKQMVQLDEKALEIDEKRQKAATEITLQTAEAAKKLKEQADAIAANLEKQKGAGDTTARVKQSKDNYGDERNEAVMRGATQATLAQMDALQKLKEAEIELEGMAERKEAIETQAAARENALQQQYLAHEITKKQLADDLAASRRQELADLGQLQQAYAASAASAGAAGVKAMAEVTATENEIQGQLEKQKNAMDGFLHDVLDPLTNKPKSIADAFKSMADNVLKDLERISEKKIIDNLDMAIGGAGKGGPGAGAGGAAGGAAGMAGGIGAKLGGLFGGIFGGKSNGPSNGGLAPGAGTIASDAAAKLGGGKLPGGAGGAVTVNIINQGQAVASDGATSADSGLEGKVVSIILKQAENLGPLSSLFNQGGSTPAGGGGGTYS